MKKEVLRIENATLVKDGIVYLDNFSVHISEGEIMGMIWKNHHGIDEMIHLICDNSLLKYGRLYLKERLVNTYLKEVKRNNKVFVIDKKSRLIKDLSVADNIFVLRKGFKKYLINQRRLAIQVKSVLEDLDFQIDPGLLVAELSQFERCVVELVKAVLMGTNLIIIKEISEVLSRVELARFYDLIRHYALKGIAFMYIANHHEEAFQICDKMALLEDGKVIKTLFNDELDDQHIQPFVKQITKPLRTTLKEEKVILKFKDVETTNLRQFSMEASRLECLALLDCDNTALSDIVSLTVGKALPQSGEVLLEGKSIHITNKRFHEDAVIIAENPIKTMIFPEMTYMENLCFLIDRKIGRSVLKRNYYKSVIKEYEHELGDEIKSRQLEQLSPQSLYNIIYYRVLLYHPKLVFIWQPFSGADMYLRSHIAKLIKRLKDEEISVILLTSQMTDILAVSDRLLIIKGGELETKQILE